jgi:hypothetical protein
MCLLARVLYMGLDFVTYETYKRKQFEVPLKNHRCALGVMRTGRWEMGPNVICLAEQRQQSLHINKVSLDYIYCNIHFYVS